jgi:O-antigen/teichoic acid export membrane protein
MLAWTVASGLSRVSSPLIQAFSPHFTELVSRGDGRALVKHARLSSQLMSVLILPPTALIVFFANPILMAWMGNRDIAAGTAPILAVVVVGTALSACSYPAVSILYSKRQLRPVVVVNLFSLLLLLPLLMVAVINFGVMGAAFCWVLYGLILYSVYQFCGLRDLPLAGFFSSILHDFVAPCFVSFVIAGVSWYFFQGVTSKTELVALSGSILIVGWVAALFVCRDLFKIVVGKLK